VVLVHTSPRQGSAVQQAVSKAFTSFWTALHDFARHNRSCIAKGWDRIVLCCLFASRFPCTGVPVPTGSASSIAFGWMFCLADYVRRAMLSPRLRAILFTMSGFTLPLRFVSPCSFNHTWRGWWRGYPAFHVATCLIYSPLSMPHHSDSSCRVAATPNHLLVCRRSTVLDTEAQICD
jgi:hypothetical protein